MTITQDEKPTTEERYSSATKASNLRVEAERGGAGDVLIAASWSNSRIGATLMRLHSEFDGSSRPPSAGGETDFRLLMMSLKSYGDALAQITLRAELWDMHKPEYAATLAILHWLDDGCRKCNKLGFEKIPGTPSLSSRTCRTCRGTGRKLLPNGEDGKRLEIHIKNCVAAATNLMRHRLRAYTPVRK